MPKYLLTVTAMADRDESCNLYTYTETFDLGSRRPTPAKVCSHVEDVKQTFLDSWPHHRQAKPIVVPVNVDIIDIHATEVHA